MRVMGIDPGLTRCGLGVVDVDASRRASLVYVGVARTDKDLATHFRLRTIADAIDSVIADVSRGLGEAMVGINVDDLPVDHRLAERGW